MLVMSLPIYPVAPDTVLPELMELPREGPCGMIALLIFSPANQVTHNVPESGHEPCIKRTKNALYRYFK